MKAVVVAAISSLGLLSGIGVAGNEATHGGWAETMGLGHHHLADYGHYHCVSHDSQAHLKHMHNGTTSDHQHCAGGVQMHGDGHAHSHGGMNHA